MLIIVESLPLIPVFYSLSSSNWLPVAIIQGSFIVGIFHAIYAHGVDINLMSIKDLALKGKRKLF